MDNIAVFGALDADALASLADAIERESGPSALVSLTSTCTALWRGQTFRLDNGTGPHALNGKLDGLRQQRIEALQQKLKCDDILSLLRSSPNLRGFAVDDSDARMIASLYLHDLSDEANGKVIRCECHSHSSPVYGTSCCESLLVLPRVVVWMADLSQSMSSWASRQSPPSTSIPGGWAQSPPSS